MDIKGGKSKGPVIAGLCLGRTTGGPYKTILQFRQTLGGLIVSFSDAAEVEVVPGDGVEHLYTRTGRLTRWYRMLTRSGRRRFRELAGDPSHLESHILFRHHAWVVYREAKRLGVPYWIIPHGCLDPYVFTYRGWVKLLWMNLAGRRILRNAKYVIFSSKRELEKASCWMSGDNARVIRWPVSLSHPPRNAAVRTILRERLGLHRDARVLLWLGRLHPMKRPLESAELFAQTMPANAHLVMYGGDEAGLAERLRKIESDAPRQNVHWLGPVYGAEKDFVLQGCDGYWSYSQRENFNHAAAEAMAAALPIILSPGNDLSNDLADAGVGWMLKDDSRSTVQEALTAWASASEGAIDETGSRGRSWAAEHLSFEKFAQQLKALEGQSE